MERNEMGSRKILSWAGWSLFWMAIAVFVSQTLIYIIVNALFKEALDSSWYGFSVTAVSVVGVGLPVFYMLIRKIPDSEQQEPIKISLIQFIGYFFVCVAFMYLSNMLGQFINYMISQIKGDRVINPIEDVLINSNMVLNLLYVSIVGPIVEELIFRKLLLNKLRRFGDVPAILLTAFAFGFFHMNLYQFFYATVLGIFFAFITLRTNTVRYAMLLHIIVNFMGSVLSLTIINSKNFIYIGLMGWGIIFFMIMGIILFFRNIKSVRLEKGVMPVERKSVYILNAGTIMFLLICIIMTIEMVLR